MFSNPQIPKPKAITTATVKGLRSRIAIKPKSTTKSPAMAIKEDFVLIYKKIPTNNNMSIPIENCMVSVAIPQEFSKFWTIPEIGCKFVNQLDDDGAVGEG